MNRRMTLEPAGHEEGAICLPFRQISGFRMSAGSRELRSSKAIRDIYYESINERR